MQSPSITEGMLSKAVGNVQALARGAHSLVQGSSLDASKIPVDGPGDDTLGAIGWAPYLLDCKAKLGALGGSAAQHSRLQRSCAGDKESPPTSRTA